MDNEKVFWPVTSFDGYGHMAVGAVAEDDPVWFSVCHCGDVHEFCGWK